MERFRLHWPALETALRPLTEEKPLPDTPESVAAGQAATPRRGSLLGSLFRLRALESFQHREYRLLWLGQAFVSTATWMDQVARGWLIYELTNSSVQLGLVRGVQAIPFLFLLPLAGSAADRYSRKMQVLAAQAIDGLLFTALAWLILTGRIQPWHVYVTAVGTAIVQTFQQPSRAAMVAEAVPRDHLTNAIGLNALMFNVARSTGPAVAGLLIAAYGTGGSYVAQALCYFLATLWTAQLRLAHRPAADAHGGAPHGVSFCQSVVEGWKFSWHNETVRTGLLVAMFAALFIIPFTTLLPVFARDLLGVGATGQGLLLTAMGIGALGSSALIASAGDRLPRGIFMIGGGALYGLVVVSFSASAWFSFSVVLMGITGFCHVTCHALVQTVIQAYSPSEFRGRTMATFHMNQAVLTVGSMLLGALSSLIGSRWAMASMGAVGTLAMIAIYMALPRARLIR